MRLQCVVLTRPRLEPELFRTIVYAPSAIPGLPAIRSRKELFTILLRRRSSFRHTHNLFVASRASDATLWVLIDACANLRDFKLYRRTNAWRVVPFGHCGLTHLACSVECIVEDAMFVEKWPCFQTLTHLMLDLPSELIRRVCVWLATLPRLSHLSLRWERVYEGNVLEFLLALPKLKCLVIRHLAGTRIGRSLCDNARVLIEPVESWLDRGHDWQHGCTGGVDTWTRAEQAVAGEPVADPSINWTLTRKSAADWLAWFDLYYMFY
jgi:hypothetical protein